MGPTPRVYRLTALVLLTGLAAGLVGCATQTVSSETNSPTFQDYPLDENPRIDVRWRKDVGLEGLQTYRPREQASPTLIPRTDRYDLGVGTGSGMVYILRAGDGQERWRRSLKHGIRAAPTVGAQRMYVGTAGGQIVALDRKTGETVWSVNRRFGIESKLALTPNLVLAATNGGTLVALSRGDGSVVWTYERSAPKEFTVQGTGAPVVADGRIYAGFSDGTLVSLNAEDGSEIWNTDLSGGGADFTDIISPIVLDDERIFAVSYSAGVHALDRASGQVTWTKSMDNVSSLEPAGQWLYVTQATGRVAALSKNRGTEQWGLKLQEDLPVEATQAGPFLFVSTGSGPLYVVSRATGHPLTKWGPSNGFNTKTVFNERHGFILSNRGYLYSFSVAW